MKYVITALAATGRRLQFGIVFLLTAWLPAHAQPRTVIEAVPWSVSTGVVDIRWNRELLIELGIFFDAKDAEAAGDDGRMRFALRRDGVLTLAVLNGRLERFDSGALQVQGGGTLHVGGHDIDYRDFRLQPPKDAGNDFDLALVAADGRPWFRLTRPMYEFSADRRAINISTMDVTLSPELATLVGRPATAGWTVGDVAIDATTTALAAPQAPAAVFHWPGDPAPNGGVYRVDLFMKSMEFQYLRCDGCSGADGSGRVVFAPTSMLRNNANNGSVAVYTIPNDPLGYSTALWPAGVAWYPKFSGIFAPYQNDQHPFLVWNMYRINAAGGIEQIGRSGAKHAYLTTNNGCLDADDHDFHVLGRGCQDTYTYSHNDNGNSLGPRSEIIAATGQWGRCGSIFDPGCSGLPSAVNNGSYDQRMVVSERQISSTVNPGATYLFESWYVTRDDINIYNSMATLQAVPTYSGGWDVNQQTNYRLGPAIDRWVDPAEPGSNAATSELAVAEGHAKVAVKVTNVGGAGVFWRYDYAIANLDFSRAVTSGAEPNLRVLKNEGFDQIVIPISASGVTDVRFVDGDGIASNDWTVSQTNGYLLLTAPASGNRLNWGSLYSLSFQSRAAPRASSVRLRVAQAGTPSSYSVGNLLAPAIGDQIFQHGFER